LERILNSRRAWHGLNTIAVAALAACSGRDTGSQTRDDTPMRGGTVVVAGLHDLGAMNALVTSETYTADINLHVLFLPLVSLSADVDFEPALAESWLWEADTAVVFRLRHDVRWHDGTPTTAYDVAFTFDRVKNPATGFPNASDFERWKRVETLDSFTVRAVVAPHLDPLLSWAFMPIMPKHALDSIAPAALRNAGFNNAPIGNGPFRFVEHRANDRWVFEANPDFPESLGGPPLIDRLVWRVIPENTVQVTELLSGGADLILGPLASDLDAMAGETGVRPIVKPSGQYHFIGWNGKRPPLGDARVRRALTLAIDRDEILQVLRGGRGQLASGPVGPFHWGFTESVSPLPFDTAEARQLLDQAGVIDRNGDGVRERPDGKPFSIGLEVPSSNAFGRDVAQMIQSDLAAVGIRLEVRTLEFMSIIEHISSPTRDFDAVFMGFDADFRNNVRDLFHSDAIGGEYQLASYASPIADAIIDSLAVTTDRAHATPLLHRLQRTLRDDEPLTFLWYVPNLYAARSRLHDTAMDVRGLFVNVSHWWLEDGASTTH
jgi:peptide/nickel transport system substrate-binding protein